MITPFHQHSAMVEALSALATTSERATPTPPPRQRSHRPRPHRSPGPRATGPGASQLPHPPEAIRRWHRLQHPSARPAPRPAPRRRPAPDRLADAADSGRIGVPTDWPQSGQTCSQPRPATLDQLLKCITMHGPRDLQTSPLWRDPRGRAGASIRRERAPGSADVPTRNAPLGRGCGVRRAAISTAARMRGEERASGDGRRPAMSAPLVPCREPSRRVIKRLTAVEFTWRGMSMLAAHSTSSLSDMCQVVCDSSASR